MAGKSRKELHPRMQEVLIALDCENLFQLAKKLDVPLKTLREYGYYGQHPKYCETTGRIATALGMTTEGFIASWDPPKVAIQ